MPYGFDSEKRAFVGDTKTLTAFLYDKDDANLIATASISGVEFTVLKPGQDPATDTSVAGTWTRATTTATVTSVAHGLSVGDTIFVSDSSALTAITNGTKTVATAPDADTFTFTCLNAGAASGTLTYDANVANIPGTVSGDGTGTFTVPSAIHDAVGDYRALAQFTYTEDGATKKRTVPLVYEVCDVFQRAGVTPADPAATIAWAKLEDCFDSEHGGPWLRDMTKANFDRVKLLDFVPDVLLDINVQQPITEYTEASFPWTTRDGTAFFGYGLFIATLKHLMRSYTEQPNVMNSSVGYFDRTRYQQAWAAIYQIELPEWERIRQMWKRSELDISRGSLLVGNKAGRLVNANMRGRFFGRGYLS